MTFTSTFSLLKAPNIITVKLLVSNSEACLQYLHQQAWQMSIQSSFIRKWHYLLTLLLVWLLSSIKENRVVISCILGAGQCGDLALPPQRQAQEDPGVPHPRHCNPEQHQVSRYRVDNGYLRTRYGIDM